MGVKADLIIDVEVLTHQEAQKLFSQFVKDSEDVDLDPDFQKTGDDIVSRCKGLPIAIKTIACTLKSQSKQVWDDALSRLEHGDIKEIVHNVFEMSYTNLNVETQSVFLLCGLYPEDFEIPTEELVRYGWGLKQFHNVYTISEARKRLYTCIQHLINANLLIGTHCVGPVKMHDLVRAFVLSKFSEGDHASIVYHGDMSKWPLEDMSKSCKRMSLTCKGMCEFPGELFKNPNLSLLKLIHGDDLLMHAQDFYGGMENLHVIAYERTCYMSFPISLKCSTNLRTLCLERCSLTFDCSFIGNLQNLEVLSFAYSEIQKLPLIFQKLNKLRLLDLTGCSELHIDKGVFRNLVKLEELYMRVDRRDAISFIDGSSNEFEECSKNLSALEFEFCENDAQPMNMVFEKLESFNISMGCFLDYLDRLFKTQGICENLLPFENKLMLVTSKGELLESRMNDLFQKTNVLSLTVSEMSNLEEVAVDVKSLSVPKQYLFHHLRFLSVSRCKQLKYLFTSCLASAMSKLEGLHISSCPIMETLIHNENSGSETIRFPKLKFLMLSDLPMLGSLSHTSNHVIELSQLVELELCGLPKITHIFSKSNTSVVGLLMKDGVVPRKLEILHIEKMQNLKELWLSEEVASSENVNLSMLREIKVRGCDSLVNLFPINPMPLLLNLIDLKVVKCGSVEVLFNFDLGCVSEMEGICSLRRIEVNELEKLKEVWRMKGVDKSNLPIHGFQALESLSITECSCFRNLFTPTTASFDLRALKNIEIGGAERKNEFAEINEEQEIVIKSEEDNIANVAVSSHLMLSFPHLHTLDLGIKGREVVFEIEGALPLLPSLKELRLLYMNEMRHVWKCNWNHFFIIQQQPPKSSFSSLTNINLIACKSIKYLFSPLMLKLLLNLQYVRIEYCDDIEEVVSNRDDEDHEMSTLTNSPFSPILDDLILTKLRSLQHVGGGGATSAIISNNIITTTSVDNKFQRTQIDAALWSLCQYSRRIYVRYCDALSSLIPSHAVRHLQNLEVLKVTCCNSMVEVFETRREGNGNVEKFTIVPQLCNLKKLEIFGCDSLRYLFTFSTLKSLKQLKELKFSGCINIEVIVKEEDGADTSKVVVFPCLKSVKLINLPNLNGFFLGTNEFQWHLLDEVVIEYCPKMTMFTHGRSTSPMLKYISNEFGKYSLECGLNFHMTTCLQEPSFTSLDASSCSSTIPKMMPWSVPNLIKFKLSPMVEFKGVLIPSNDLQHLENLEKIRVRDQDYVEGIFEVLKRTNNEAPSVIKIPNLREVKLGKLRRLEYIWKSNQWTIPLEFPNLTRLSIHKCKSLGHVFTRSMVGSLLQLQELHIENCDKMKVIVKEDEEGDATVNNEIIMFPCLKSLILSELIELEGFLLGSDQGVEWPSLVTLKIAYCFRMKFFTKGKSTAPMLKVIDTGNGIFDANEDLNSTFERLK